ncbi:unnamed protein product [Amoebophrya sp. A25]|nr:unnamed protein product [Amoebophrya sp. A25]|eukprot:GSA25T00014821001.1
MELNRGYLACLTITCILHHQGCLIISWQNAKNGETFRIYKLWPRTASGTDSSDQ